VLLDKQVGDSVGRLDMGVLCTCAAPRAAQEHSSLNLLTPTLLAHPTAHGAGRKEKRRQILQASKERARAEGKAVDAFATPDYSLPEKALSARGGC